MPKSVGAQEGLLPLPVNKAADFKQNNYIAGVQYWFYPRCRLQAQYTFCDKKGNGQKDSNLIQAQVQVRF